jgi:hypothetical protein
VTQTILAANIGCANSYTGKIAWVTVQFCNQVSNNHRTFRA